MGELHWRDVDFPRSVIRLRTSYAEGELSVPKPGNVRSVPMVPEIAQQLARLAERDAGTDDDDLVFAEPHGEWLNDDKLRRRYDAAAWEASLRRLRYLHYRDRGQAAERLADAFHVAPTPAGRPATPLTDDASCIRPAPPPCCRRLRR
jgi:hypothetical protein